MALQSRPTLILTRPALATHRFAQEVAAVISADLPVLIAPLLAPRYLSPVLPPDPPAGVIFTSETGVEALSRLVTWRCRAICVGPRTRDAAQDQGWQAEIRGGDAEGLLREILALRPEGLWIHARGRDAAGSLGQRLAENGFPITEIVTYVQDPLPLSEPAMRLLTGRERVILPVFSPRSGRVLVAELTRRGQAPLAPLLVAAISPAAAQSVTALSPAHVEIAATPDGPGMLGAIARLPGAAG